jgi:ABC-2 type transport system permease protein
MNLMYARCELLRTFRNRRFFLFTLGFPVILYFVIAGPNRHVHDFANSGLSAPLYYMIGLVGFGTMAGMLSSGARIAAERTAGWTRQLRITPLSPRAYFRVKVATGYLMAFVTIAVLYACGAALGVSIPAGRWLEMTGMILVGLLPFAAMGIVLGHLVTADSVGPAVGGLLSLLALVGGSWFPISGHGLLHDIAQFIPSYWLIRASHIAVGGHGWNGEGWSVMAAWTLAGVIAGAWAYRRDTGRV